MGVSIPHTLQALMLLGCRTGFAHMCCNGSRKINKVATSS